MIPVSRTLKFTQLIARNVIVEQRNDKYSASALPVLPAMPMADSTNRCQHPRAQTCQHNPQKAISKGLENISVRVKLSSFITWRAGARSSRCNSGSIGHLQWLLSTPLNSPSLLLNFLIRTVALCKRGCWWWWSFFFGLLMLWHMEVPRLGVQSELQLLAYATATAWQDPQPTEWGQGSNPYPHR